MQVFHPAQSASITMRSIARRFSEIYSDPQICYAATLAAHVQTASVELHAINPVRPHIWRLAQHMDAVAADHEMTGIDLRGYVKTWVTILHSYALRAEADEREAAAASAPNVRRMPWLRLAWGGSVVG